MRTFTPSIFIVEDDNFYATMVRSHLEENSYRRTKIFNNGNDAIEELYKHPDIVLLDYDLGDMKGIDILRKIKSVNPNIQVIFLSGQEDLEVAVTSLKYGAFDYLEKNGETFARLSRVLDRIEHHRGMIEEKDTFKIVRNILIGALATTATLIFMLKDQIFQ